MIRKSEFVAKTQFLCRKSTRFIVYTLLLKSNQIKQENKLKKHCY